MAGNNCKHHKPICLFLAAFLWLIQTPGPALAWRLPFGAISSSTRLGGTSSDRDKSSSTYNLSYVPMLLELAKVLGRFQPAPGYYLQNEPFANQPGIDLRSLLLNQSGPLQLLHELQQAGQGLPDADGSKANLAVPRLESQSSGTPDSMAPQLQVPVLPAFNHPAPISHPPAQVASPDKINLPVSSQELTNTPAPLVTLDFPSLSHTFTGIKAAIPQVPVDAPQLQTSVAASIPLSPAAPNHTYAFLFWTLRSTAAVNSVKNYQLSNQDLDNLDKTTLVACMPGTRFQSVSRDKMYLSQGRLLAFNASRPLSLQTGLAEIQMNGRSALTLDLSKSGLLVNALETTTPGDITVLYTDTSGNLQKIQLAAGQTLFLPGEKQAAIPGHFSISTFLQNDPLLNAGNPELSEAQRNALLCLQQRLKESLQVEK